MTRRIFILFACLYILSLGRGFYGSDGEVMFKTTAALVKHHTLALDPDPGLPQIVAGQDRHYYGKYDPGLPLIGLPFYWTGDQIAAINSAHRYRCAALFYLLIPALAAAGTVTALFVLARDLYGERRALGIALTAGLATILWPYARFLFAESLLACALTTAVLFAHRGKPWLAGLVLGVGLLTRAALGLYALPLVLLIIKTKNYSPQRKEEEKEIPQGGNDSSLFFSKLSVVKFFSAIAPFVLVLLAHNAYRFGHPFQFGYPGEGFTTPIWEGISGLLFSPGKSIFVFAPPLILTVALAPRFRRAQPLLAEFMMLAWLLALIFYGLWWAWGGGWSWGPRFLVPLIPISLLPLGYLPDGRDWRIATVLLIGLGVLVQSLGLLVDHSRYHAPAWSIREMPLIWSIQQVTHGHTEPLALFHLTDTGLPATWTVGVPVLLILGLIYALHPGKP